MNGGHGIILTYESSLNGREILRFSKKKKKKSILFINSIYPIFMLSTQKKCNFLYRNYQTTIDKRK